MINLKNDMKNIYNDWYKLNMKDINAMREEFANSKFVKDDQGKEKYTMIPQLALKQVAKVFTHGADKYGDFNYSKQCDVLRYIDAMQRHTNQYLTGEDMDESGVHHLACVAANALMALDGILNETMIDNRNKFYGKKSMGI
jgi:hypothetical protein